MIKTFFFEQIFRDFNLSKDDGTALFWNINKINQTVIESLAPLDLKKLHEIFLLFVIMEYFTKLNWMKCSSSRF
ncbi:unnamed protein product [Paramecium pentaurelia]|uniref:Uncharacterized protein n=1 Tax=Paramecium pentaurelia TaxID=43138 RepID=A0A8S1XSR4_9CILI|nr:unnamed protein product [Paramecium pentaurelia]